MLYTCMHSDFILQDLAKKQSNHVYKYITSVINQSQVPAVIFLIFSSAESDLHN